MGLWLAKAIVEQLTERAQAPMPWPHCFVCRTQLNSKGFVKRRVLTFVDWVKWKRRVGIYPHRPCSQRTPFDYTVGIQAYQQTSTELTWLGCLLAVFLPFELASWVLQQLSLELL